MRALITGWFSFANGEATAGDLMAAETVCRWLTRTGVPFDTAFSPAFGSGLTLDDVRPGDYSHLVFVCGPAAGPQVEELAARFPHARRIAVGVSVVDSTPDVWHEVIARDSGHAGRPDLSFATAAEPLPPVVGLVEAHAQPEYPRARHEEVHELIERVLADREAAVVPLGTRVDPRGLEFRHFHHVEAALARVDAVVSTRLHGLVLALRRGRPGVAVDPVPGGGKVIAQADALGWPAAVTADDLDGERLGDLLDWSLGPQAADAVAAAVARGCRDLPQVERSLVQALLDGGAPAEPG